MEKVGAYSWSIGPFSHSLSPSSGKLVMMAYDGPGLISLDWVLIGIGGGGAADRNSDQWQTLRLLRSLRLVRMLRMIKLR